MKHRRALAMLAVLTAAAAFFIGPISSVATAAPATRPPTGKLTPRLAELASGALRDASRARQAEALSLPARGAGSLLRRGDRVLVDVLVARDAGSHVGSLRAAGAQIVHVSARYRTITAAVAPSSLHAVARVPGVRNVSEILTPMVAGSGPASKAQPAAATSTCPVGNKVSEGDVQLHANTARSNFSINGSGVKVGVLSDSYDHDSSAATHAADDVASGDLPGSTNTCGFTAPVQVVDDTATGGEDEGRAMLQIVHDLAPGAPLAFATAFTGETAFADNIRDLKTAGAKVIVDDVTYFDEPFFQDGPVSVAVNDVTGGGAAYYSSAANNNLIVGGHNAASFEAPAFRNSGNCPTVLANNGFHQCMDFDPTTGVDRTYGLSVGPGSTVRIDLQWAQPWFGVATDLDAYILNSAGTSILARSEAANVSGTQKPFELVAYRNTSGSPQTVNFAINRFTGAGGGNSGTPRVKFALLENGDTSVFPTEYTASSGGDVIGPDIFGHNGADNAMSVAAVPYNNSNTVEPYSSRGPVTLRFGPVNGTTPAPAITPKTLAKPDISATDCGVTTFFASFDGTNWRFCGTSAAAPHAAAVAALERQLSPGAGFAAIRDSQTSTAAPVDSFGHPSAGAGLLNAQAAATALSNTHTLTVAKNGTGKGTVTSNDGRINCGPTCSANYTSAGTVVLTATPVTGAQFVSWTNCDSPSGNHCTENVGTANKTVTAKFNDVATPKVTMKAPAKAFQTSNTIHVAWTATDTGGSGIKNFDVFLKSAFATSGTFTSYQPVNGAQGITVTAINVTLSGNPAGNTICFAVKARDNAGHVSGLGIKPKCTELPIDDKQFSSHPGFTQKTVSGTYHGTVLRATAKGSQIAASGIHAKHLAVLVTKCPGCGTIKVIFKGAQVGSNISLNASTTKKKVLVLLPAFSNAKSGTLVVRVVSSGKRVDIDGVGTSLV